MEIDNKHINIIICLLTLSLFFNFISVKKYNNYVSDKNIFCGIKNLPNGYNRYGSRYECLKRGFGAGMNKNDKKYPLKHLGILFIIVTICILIYNYNKNKNNKNVNNDN